jgi:SAM-dependent methyltransferase
MPAKDVWADGSAYDMFMGRWSQRVAEVFLDWLAVASNRQWIDVGCGTGALSQAILEAAHAASVHGFDRAEPFVAVARRHITDQRARFVAADASALPAPTASCDACVSGLMLNFVPDPLAVAREMARTVRSGGVVAAYVWDYAGKMEFLRQFWDAAVELDPAARELDEGRRFPLCDPRALEQLFQAAGLHAVEVRPIDVATIFHDLDDFWLPFLGGQGPAPSYVASLGDEQRLALRERLRQTLPLAEDGTIRLAARAWAARGRR